LTPFEKHAKTQDSRAKMPPKLKLISYNAIANGARMHTKTCLGTFGAGGIFGM
jgi:hypothetical protein